MKAQLSQFFRQLPVTVYLVVGAVAAAGGWLAINNAHQRELGALEVTQHAKLAAADSALKVLTRKNEGLDSLVATFSAAAAKYQAGKHASDVQAGKLRSARDSLAEAIADSLATIETLRARATRLIIASDSAEIAHGKERQSADSALKAAKRSLTFAVDSVRAASQTALDRMRERAETAERVTKARATGWRAALLGRCGLNVGGGVVTSGGRGYAGAGATLGCKVFPW